MTLEETRNEVQDAVDAFLTDVDAYDGLVDLYDEHLRAHGPDHSREQELERLTDRLVVTERHIMDNKHALDAYLQKASRAEGIRTLPGFSSTQQAYEAVKDDIDLAGMSSIADIGTAIEKLARKDEQLELEYEFIPIVSLESYLFTREKEGRPQYDSTDKAQGVIWNDEVVREELEDRLEDEFGPDYDEDDPDIAQRRSELYQDIVEEQSRPHVSEPSEQDTIIETLNSYDPYLNDAIETYTNRRSTVTSHDEDLEPILGTTMAEKRANADLPDEPLFDPPEDLIAVLDVARIAYAEL